MARAYGQLSCALFPFSCPYITQQRSTLYISLHARLNVIWKKSQRKADHMDTAILRDYIHWYTVYVQIGWFLSIGTVYSYHEGLQASSQWLQASSQWKLPQWCKHCIISAHVHSRSMYEPYMYIVCTMYIHGINSCLNRFSWSTERRRCRTAGLGHPWWPLLPPGLVQYISTSMYMAVTCTYNNINSCTCMYIVHW
jgi:hypothetical protein